MTGNGKILFIFKPALKDGPIKNGRIIFKRLYMHVYDGTE